VTTGAAAGGVGGGVGAVAAGVGGGVKAVVSTGSAGGVSCATFGANVSRSIAGFSSTTGGGETGAVRGAERGAERSVSEAEVSVLDFSHGGVLGPSSSTFANELIFVEPPSEFSPKKVLI
jgi:hypothetical protein